MSLIGHSAESLIPAPSPVPELLRDYIHERTGIFFDDERLPLMLEKLEDRVRELSCPSYLEYYYILKYDELGPDEWKRVLNAFSVQETYFWRESDQIQALARTIVPAWFRQHPGPLQIWSAACATGEEPYSIAIALHEAGLQGLPIEIIGTDGSELALQKATSAIFRERSFRSLPPHLRQKYFTKTPTGEKLNSNIAKTVSFHWANLMNPADIHRFASAPVIFCRNVFIYFSEKSIGRVLSCFAERMPSGGHLFVGSSESLLKLSNDFDLNQIDQAFVYVRKPKSIHGAA